MLLTTHTESTIIAEIISNRDKYDGDGRVSISRLPAIIRRSLEAIDSMLIKQISYHNGINLLSVICLCEGVKMIKDSDKVQELIKYRNKYYSYLTSNKHVDEMLHREMEALFDDWKFFVRGDSYGGRRLIIDKVPQDMAIGVRALATKLSLQISDISSIAMARYLYEQEQCLNSSTRKELRQIFDGFNNRVKIRNRVLECGIEIIESQNMRKDH